MALYNRFRPYQKYLLEGQQDIMEKLSKGFFSQLTPSEKTYYPTLVRMPTGTGKTGIIALTSFFGNESGSTLILTPWRNLCDQLTLDLQKNFWENLVIPSSQRMAFDALIQKNTFATNRMMPTTVSSLLEKKNGQRFICIGTLSGLQQLQRDEGETYDKLAKAISLVIVDEGHYEPAVKWGKAIKGLNKPTLIVTATPYRNDLKLFKVPKERVFHYPHFRATQAAKFPLREVKPIPLKASSADFKNVIAEFLKQWKKIKASLPPETPRAIICCANKKQVMHAMEIVHAHGITVMGFHERVEATDYAEGHPLKEMFLSKVPVAKKHDEEIWVHQNKLTEGLDDSRFCGILFTYPILNDRKLVQQVGRVLRHTPNAKPGITHQIAMVAHCSDYEFEEIWNNYEEFDRQEDDLITPDHYRSVVIKFLDLQPKYEYFGKRFRKRLDPFALMSMKKLKGESDEEFKNQIAKKRREWADEAWRSILTKPSVLVLKENPDIKMEEFIEDTSIDLELNDAVVLNPEATNEPTINESNKLLLWLYAYVKNADILLTKSSYEISIETKFVYRTGGYLFIGDSGGSAHGDYLSDYAGTATYFDLKRGLDKDYIISQASLFNTQSLNNVVRRTIRQGIDLGGAPYQISEKKYIVQNLRARKRGVSGDRYYGLSTGRVSDRLNSGKRRKFNLSEFRLWADELVKQLAVDNHHDFLGRHASIQNPPDDAIPYALIFDPSPDPSNGQSSLSNEDSEEDLFVTWVVASTKEKVNCEETVFQVSENPDDDWPYKIDVVINVMEERREVKSGTIRSIEVKKTTEVLIRYDERTKIFRFRKGSLTEIQAEYKTEVELISKLLNVLSDRFVITLANHSLVYHNKQFFELDYSNAEAKVNTFAKKVSQLKDVDFEKLPKDFRGKKTLTGWPAKSVFAKTLDHVITRHNFKTDIEFVFCDDPGKEVADFLVANFTTRKLAFVHCKHGRGKRLSASAFHDLCSQGSKNLGYLRTARVPPNVKTWAKGALWDKSKIKKWIAGSDTLPEQTNLWKKMKDDIINHPDGIIEVWLVMGDGLDVDKLHEMARRKNQTAELGPLLHLLDGLTASCAEAGARLLVFGH